MLIINRGFETIFENFNFQKLSVQSRFLLKADSEKNDVKILAKASSFLPGNKVSAED